MSTRVRHAATGSVAVVLVVALAVMANWIAARKWVRSDWTSSSLYTLSEKTNAIVRDLAEPVQVVVFMTPSSPLFPQVKELLSRYEALSSQLTVDYIDPDREPIKTKSLAEKFGISVANTVVFAAGDRTKYVSSDQMAEYDYSGMQYGQPASMKAFKGEEQFTAAILSLVAPDVPKVYFVSGHGEAGLEPAVDATAPSLATLKEALKRENMVAEQTVILSGDIPADADALVIAGPTQPYTDHELTALAAYLDRGGRLMVCLDPLIEPTGSMRPTRLEAFLAERGIDVRDDLVVDPSRKLPFYDLSAVYLTDFPEHPVTQGLTDVAVLFLVARSLAATVDGEAQVVVETSSEGWGETDLAGLLQGVPVERGDRDNASPAGVGVAVETAADPAATTADGVPAPAARILAFGDSDFMADGQIGNAGNLTLALNSLNWLVARDHAVGVPPRAVEQVSLYLTDSQMGTIFLLTLVGLPGAAIVAGIFVWRRRRH